MTDYTSLYLLSDEERAYFVKLYEEITQGLLEEGIDYRPIRFDLPGLLTVEQITRINRSLSAGPIRALKAAQEAAGRKAFMFMRVDPDKLRVLPVEDFAAHFPNAPADHVKKNTYFSAPDAPAFVAFKEWYLLLSDKISFVGTPELQPITPYTPEYFLLEDHPDTQDTDPETIAKLRDLLGLQDHRFIGLSLWEQISTCKQFLEETAPIWRAGAAEKAAAGKEKRDAAAQSGAIVNVWAAYAAPESKDDKLAPFYNQMLSRDNIYELSPSADMSLFDDRGRLSSLLPKDQQPIAINRAQAGLFHTLLSAAAQATESGNDQSNTVPLHLPSFFQKTGIDPRPYSAKRTDLATTPQQTRADKMYEIISPFERYVGKAPDGSLYRFAVFSSYNVSTETFSIHCPYFFECARQISLDRFKRLAHADLANERNQAAVEIVFFLLRGLATRGITTPDGKTWNAQTETETPEEEKKPRLFSYKISYKGIVANCPQIKHELEGIITSDSKTKNQAYNAKLKQTFSAAVHLLKSKTDAPQYYKNFKIHAAPLPTKSTLRTFLTITYEGKNEDFIE